MTVTVSFNFCQLIIYIFIIRQFIVWKGDGICDDINNNEHCEYDGGDCCGANVKKQYCFECQCISNLNDPF